MDKEQLRILGDQSDQFAKPKQIRYDDEALMELYKIIRSQRDELRQMAHRIDLLMAIVSISVFFSMVGLFI